jgi:5-methylcytosine-specific restriction endonuclease McrA
MDEAYDLARLRTISTGINWHVDHVVPLRSKIVSGLHSHTNLEVIPGVENLRKTNRFWPEMAA